MPSDLITLATFQGATEAHIARNQLESTGIQATLADEMTTTAAWFLTSAVGGIKLQVAREDAERAAAILTETESFELGTERWDEEAAEGEFEDDFAEEKEQENENEEVEALLTEADALARRAFRAALLGLIFLPLQLYAIWLLTLFLFEPSRANTKSRWRLFWAWIFCLPVILIALGIATCDLESLFAV